MRQTPCRVSKMIQHAEILNRLWQFPGLSHIRRLLLKDLIIQCDLKIHCLDRGSLDPLVGAIREHLEPDSWITLDGLTEAVGGEGEPGRRVVAEVLAVLEREKEVRCKEEPGGVFQFAANITRWRSRYVRERFVEQQFFFVPRSKEFATRIQGKTKSNIEKISRSEGLQKWWEPPDSRNIYSDHALEKELKLACMEYCRVSKLITPMSDFHEARLEALQRSKLSFTQLKPVSALVLRRRRTKLWRLHECYLYNSSESGTGRWRVEVYQYPQGPLQVEYTHYLKLLIESEREMFLNLWDTASLFAPNMDGYTGR